MSNIIDSIQLSGVTYAIQGSGGKAIEAGRGISITTGETADTVSFNLPISAGTGSNSIAEGGATAGGHYSHAEGYDTTANGNNSHAEGYGTTASGNSSHAEGYYTTANGNYSHAEGYYTTANGNNSHAEGDSTTANNKSEHASGQYNVSSKASTTFGDSGNTLFSVGNGTVGARHNAFEIRQNGDIYLSSGGTDIKLQDHLGGGGGGNPTVELTQAEYDALVTAGTVSPTTYYIITDAQAGDLSQYWTSAQTNSAITQATSGKVDTSTYNTYTAATDTALANKQTTLTAGTGIDITDNVISATGGGGGKAIEAGRGISITTGETADTVSFNLPISAGTGNGALIIASDTYNLNNKATGDYAVSLNGGGIHPNYAKGNRSLAEGADTKAFGESCHAEGYNTSAGTNSYPITSNAHAEGGKTHAAGNNSHAEGYYTIANNSSEHASGQYNVSSSASTTFGNSGNTLFSVGNGTSSARHNAFEIRQNGDIYCSDGTNDVKLQDTITATAANTAALGGLSLVKLTQSEYDALATKDNSTLYVIVN